MSTSSPPSLVQHMHPSAWSGREMRSRNDWCLTLDAAQQTELRAALGVAKSRGAAIPGMQAQDFPLPTLAPVLRDLCQEVVNGRGFVLLRGLDLSALSVPDAALIYWGIGSHMGRGCAQNAQGDMLGHVTDLGLDFHTDPNVRGYQTRLRLPFHNDAMDIVGLLCLRAARSGGASRIVSSTAIYNRLVRERPDLLAVMCEPFCVDRRGEAPAGKEPFYSGALFEFCQGRLFGRFNRTYVESAQRFAQVPRLSALQVQALDLVSTLCEDAELCLDMDLRPGDMQFISNYSVLHARTQYEDWPERDRRRYLLRLWLDTGLVPELPPSWAERYADMRAWAAAPKAPVFDLSLRRAELAH